MQSLNTDQELVFTLDNEKDFKNFMSFLESLSLEGVNKEILDFKTMKPYESVWNVETTDEENFIIVLGTEKTHVFLKKDKNFEQLKEKFSKYISF